MTRFWLVMLMLFVGTLWGGHNVANAAFDPCEMAPDTTIQVTVTQTLPDAPEGGTMHVCVSAPNVVLTTGQGNYQVGASPKATDLLIDGGVAASLYVQSKAVGTVVNGSQGDDFLVNYNGLGVTLNGAGGLDEAVVAVLDAPSVTARTALLDRSSSFVNYRGGMGADILRTKAHAGIVRGGKGFDTCKVRRSVTTKGCEVIKRW